MNSTSRSMLAGALSLVAATFISAAAFAQNPCPACGSQVQIKDIDKAIADAAQATGLVRSTANQIGQLNNYEYVGSGTMVDLEAKTLTKPVAVKRYTFNVMQQLWASRLDVVASNGARKIRVVKGDRAWDETWVSEKADSGTIKKLKTAPADAVAKLRGTMLWLQPHAFLSYMAFASGKKCMAPEVKACETKWSAAQENGKTAFTVEINGQAYKGTLDDRKHIASVETKVTLPSGGGAKTIVAKYSGWRVGESEGNDVANLAAYGPKSLDKFHNGLFYPGKVTYELDGVNVLDLQVTEGWNNPYTIYPEPELLAKAQ